MTSTVSVTHLFCTQVVIEGTTVAATVSVATAGAVVLVTIAGSAGSGAAVGAVSLTRKNETLVSLIYSITGCRDRHRIQGPKLEHGHGLSGVASSSSTVHGS